MKDTAEFPVKHSYLEDLFSEAEGMAEFGTWEMEMASQHLSWTDGVYDIHETNKTDYTPDVKTAINFYVPEHIPLLEESLLDLIERGIPYDLELELITAKGNRIWVRSQGKGVYDEAGELKFIRGIFQNIDASKKRKVELRNAMRKLANQNERLQHFAHIVSHNLRSHSGNFKLMLQMMHEVDEEDKVLYLEQLEKVANSLQETIQNLEEVVNADNQDANPIMVDMVPLIKKAEDALGAELQAARGELNVDLKAWREVCFEPAYLDSILLNLLSNAVKYRSEERDLRIDLKTEIRKAKKFLLIKDNGKGIDLNRYGSKVFGLHKTFHGNKDARGIGLFITKNHVESMGGKITVSSEPEIGTTFCIEFA